MAVNTQFAIAVHLMAGLGYRCSQDTRSAQLARSVNTSASFIRRTLSKLSKAGLVTTTKGKNGSCKLARDATKISLLDIYRAVGAPEVFSIHHYKPQKPCPVSCRIKDSLGKVLLKTQNAAETSLARISLAEVLADIQKN